jgi:putative ABC transport system permease protein
MDSLWQDIRYSARTLLKRPAFTLVTMLTLGLGIGANTAIFSVVDAVLIRPLPYKHENRLVRILQNNPHAGPGGQRQSGGISTETFQQWRARAQTLSHIGVFERSTMTLAGRAAPARLVGALVSASVFPLLAVTPELGRGFGDAEEKPGNNAVVLSHRAWEWYFGFDPKILGRKIVLDGRTYPVVGVMPASFSFPDRDTMFWVPFVIKQPVVYEPGAGEVELVQTLARLKDGVTLEQAAAEANILSPTSNSPGRIEVVPLKEELVAPVRPALVVLVAAVGFVLLIACANVANLLLSRAASRQQEMGIRAMLGACRWRLIRQTITESLMLGALGGAGGIALAFWGVPLLVALDPGGIPRLSEMRVDPPAFAFTLAVSLLTGILFGLAPALRLSRMDRMQALKDGQMSGGNRTRNLLVMSEIAMAMILLTAAGVLAKGFLKLSRVELGIDPENALTFEISLPEARYKAAQAIQLYEQFLGQLQSQAGVKAAALSSALPSQGANIGVIAMNTKGVRIDAFGVRVISPDYLKASGMTLIAGRNFNEGDRAGQPLVVLVNQAYAKRFGAESAVGKTIRGAIDGAGPAQVIGVVEDVKPVGLDRVIHPEVFVDYRQSASEPGIGGIFFTVRAASDPAALIANSRVLLRRLDSELTIGNVATLSRRLADSVAQPRFYAVLLGIFATVAVTLAAVGIYGVMMFAVSQRTREIGIRAALGAKRGDIFSLVFRQGAALAAVGIVIGLVGVFALTRYLQTMVIGITTFDLPVLAVLSLVLAAIAAIACYVPARRATRIDPIVALRYE